MRGKRACRQAPSPHLRRGAPADQLAPVNFVVVGGAAAARQDRARMGARAPLLWRSRALLRHNPPRGCLLPQRWPWVTLPAVRLQGVALCGPSIQAQRPRRPRGPHLRNRPRSRRRSSPDPHSPRSTMEGLSWPYHFSRHCRLERVPTACAWGQAGAGGRVGGMGWGKEGQGGSAPGQPCMP